MRIGINARLLLQNRLEGIGWHALELISRIIKAHPEHEFVLFYDRRQDILVPPGSNIQPVIVYPPSRHPLLMWWWCRALSREVRNARLDVFYSPEVLIPHKADVPILLTIHDLSPLLLPDSLHSSYYRRLLPLNAARADHIFTVSRFSKSEIKHHLKVLPEKVSVVYNAARSVFKPVSKEIKQTIRDQFTRGNPYFIYLGSIHDRKNVDKVIQAFDHFHKKYNYGHYLVIAGKFMGHHKKAKQALLESANASKIIQVGYQPDPMVAALLASADALINLSGYEGFGMPLVEAFQAGTPVIAARASCYPEIVGEAAILVDLDNLESVNEAMRQVILQPGQYAKAGLDRVKDFDWDKSGRQVWESIYLLGNK